MDLKNIKVTYNCISIMSSKIVLKKEDPGLSTILCTIGVYKFEKALCDSGAHINLMGFAMFQNLGLGAPNITLMRLLMTDRL